jgi:uncharacterized membrane protein
VGSAILIVTFDNVEQGDKALHGLREWHFDKQIELGDAVVITKDEAGKIKVKETNEFTPKRGAISGGIAGLVVGTLLGGPIGGALLGAAAGAYAGKKIDLGVSNDEIAVVSESMDNASSAIAVQIKSVKNKDMLAAAIRQSGGKIHELSLTDELELDMENMLSRGSIR